MPRRRSRFLLAAGALAALAGAPARADDASSASNAPWQSPAQRSQARTVIPPGTPDSRCCGPVTNGKPAWVWSEYELQTLGWGNELPARGSAGVPEYAKANVNNTPARQKWISTFDGWIRATYTPMGAVTAPFREIYPDKATQDHVPVRYGVSETLYAPIVKAGKLTRTPAPPFGWINVFANQLPGTEAAWSMNVPGQMFAFTMAYDRDLRLTEPRSADTIAAEAAAVRARIGIDAPVYILDGLVVVLLTRDGRLPVRQMTVGEALDIAEPGIRRQQVREPSEPVMFEKRLQTVRMLRDKYAGRLDTPAFIRSLQFSTQDFYDGLDFFEPDERGNHYPLYTFDTATYAAARTDTPQWLAISFPRLRPNVQESWALRMVFDTMVDHFDYAYARDAVFDPQRVAGKPYRPRP